jgi:hypothetical protein
MVEISVAIDVAGYVGRALALTESLFAEFSTEGLGVALPPAVLEAPPVAAARQALQAAAQSLGATTSELVGTTDGVAITGAFVRYGAALAEYFHGLIDLTGRIDAAITPASIPDPAARAAAQGFAASLAKRLTNFLLASVLAEKATPVAFVLKMLGLMRWERIEAAPGDPLSRPHVDLALELHRLKDLIDDPALHFQNTLGWGAGDFDPSSFFAIFRDLLPREAAVRIGEIDGDPILRFGSFSMRRQSATSPPGVEFGFEALPPPIDLRTQLNDEWGVGLKTEVQLDAGATATVTPPFSFSLKPKLGEPRGEFRLYLNRNPGAPPLVILPAGLLKATAADALFGFGFRARWDAGAGKAELVPAIFAELKGGEVQLGSQGADGFIATLLSGIDLRGNFDIGVEWNMAEGLIIRASGGLEIAIPVHRSLGPLNFETVYLALRIKDDGTLSVEVSSQLAAKLGPLTASVDRLGVTLDFRFADGPEADFGPLALKLRFKPPNGVGLAVDAGIVKGGGYLYFDFEREEYAGALELVFSGFLSLKAIGLISTRMPDNSKGFSLLVIITAEFGVPLQLGFGFTLNGVGGLLGLNRTMRLDAIAAGVRTGGVESIMFPRDVIANAPRIISDLRNFFPPAPDRFLIGPMAKLGWGTPPLVTASFGVLIEIPPGNIAILGVLKVALPHEDAPLIQIKVAFIGAMEFDKQRIWFYAAMYDSRVIFVTLEGEMGLLIAWGSDANFVLSVGGFHPSFSPPPLPFPSPRLISISILNEVFARIRVEGYFAVTSNTVQFGAKVEVYIGLDEFRIEGYIAFDALFQFSPFHFIITISASIGVKVFGVGLFSVHIRGQLEGTSPWHIEGEGSISILFFDLDVPFSHSWGEAVNTVLPPIEVVPKLMAELEKLENWRASVPVGNSLLVSLREIKATQDLVLHPVGSLSVAQRAIPLDLDLDRVGNQRPSDAKRLQVVVAGSAARPLHLERHGDLGAQLHQRVVVRALDLVGEALPQPGQEAVVGDGIAHAAIRTSADGITWRSCASVGSAANCCFSASCACAWLAKLWPATAVLLTAEAMT